MNKKKCINCNTLVTPIVDTKIKGKLSGKVEEVYSEFCPVCVNLIYGYSKEIRNR